MLIQSLIPKAEFDRVRAATLPPEIELPLLADMCRANALAAVKRAGSGHLGSSFSAMDVVTWLYFEEMNTLKIGHESPDRDVYFSSKGHDVPGLYSVLFAAGIIAREKFLKLRRFGGLDGHPDVQTAGIEANSGSLGMGISKGRGMAWAKRRLKRGGRVFVMLGDGELQEGQNYEALQAAVQQKISNLTVIVDSNKVQSDKPVDEIVSLGDLENKFRAFGWQAVACDGHDFASLRQALLEVKKIGDRPQVIIANTIKGRGVSFMEHPRALRDAGGYYKWHAGAPDDAAFTAAYTELVTRINAHLAGAGLAEVNLETLEPLEAKFVAVPRNALGEPISQGREVAAKASSTSNEYVAEAYGKALVKAAETHPNLVVLDGDLAADCRVREFELAYPDRFIENGIAEQDMVSMAGGLARHGLLPVVNSFASFLAARANEQIYNNASERSKIIYACHYAGLIPAGPGKSHQSIRDISLLGALPNLTIIQPCNAQEATWAVDYCVDEAQESCVLRLNIGPSPRLIALPPDYQFKLGQGVSLTQGKDALLFAYGSVMLHEALVAAEILAAQGFGLQVVNLPWLNRINAQWLQTIVAPHQTIYVLEDHAPVGGLADQLLVTLNSQKILGARRFSRFAVEGYPACGTPTEALQYHRLDGDSLAKQILNLE